MENSIPKLIVAAAENLREDIDDDELSELRIGILGDIETIIDWILKNNAYV